MGLEVGRTPVLPPDGVDPCWRPELGYRFEISRSSHELRRKVGYFRRLQTWAADDFFGR